jgi:hypothetical protein
LSLGRGPVAEREARGEGGGLVSPFAKPPPPHMAVMSN